MRSFIVFILFYLILIFLNCAMPQTAAIPCTKKGTTCDMQTSKKNMTDAKNKKLKFKMKLISIQNCKLPSNSIDQSHPVSVRSSMKRINRDTVLINFELNVTRRIGPFLSSARAYSIRQNSVKDLVAKVEKAPCNSALSKQLNIMLSMKFDHQCYVVPGNYVLKDFNINSLAWAMTVAAIAPGIFIYELEHSHPKGIVDCTMLTCELTELK